MKKTKLYIFAVLFIIIPKTSFGLIEVDITRGNLNPLPIAVSPLFVESKSVKEFQNLLKKENIGEDISTVVENNLKPSGLFNPLKKEAFLQKPDIAHLKPRFEDWSLIKAQALITGEVKYENDKLRVEIESIYTKHEERVNGITNFTKRNSDLIGDWFEKRRNKYERDIDFGIVFLKEKDQELKNLLKDKKAILEGRLVNLEFYLQSLQNVVSIISSEYKSVN